MSHERVSNDVTLFQSLIETDLSISSVRWEVFGTPEYSGGVPGPTDYVTLIAEVEPADSARFQSRSREGRVWIAPESARPWLVEGFRSLLGKHRNRNLDLSLMPNCRKLQGKLKKTSKLVEGFVCNDHGKSLIYFALSDNTTS
jgi:hypothetical protein